MNLFQCVRTAARWPFAKAPQALSGYLSVSELVRVTVVALMAGGGVLGVLQAIAASAGTIFLQPTDAALAAAVLTALVEIVRRLRQGGQPIQARVSSLPPGWSHTREQKVS